LMSVFGLQRLYIGGGYVDATSGKTFDTFDPATGELLAQVQQASAADVDRAVASAQEGQREWAAMTAMQRARILRRAVDLLRERRFAPFFTTQFLGALNDNVFKIGFTALV
ncbi:aldehyde dehydrogenase family protein, partial [Clostridioides difficile]|nr:aldehyde dehydrogenase family protein [Clostridioides difficile]